MPPLCPEEQRAELSQLVAKHFEAQSFENECLPPELPLRLHPQLFASLLPSYVTQRVQELVSLHLKGQAQAPLYRSSDETEVCSLLLSFE